MRDPVKKVLFIGSANSKEAFFNRAQKEGVVEFIDSRGEAAHPIPPEATRILKAKKILRRLPTLPQEDFRRKDRAMPTVERIMNLDEELDRFREEERLNHQEIVRIHVFGDFSLEDLDALKKGGRTVQFFFAKQSAHIDTEAHPGLIPVGKAFDLDYFVSITPSEVHPKGLTEMKIDKPLGELERRQAEIADKCHTLEEELKGYAKYRFALKKHLFDNLNTSILSAHHDYPEQMLEGGLFVVQGWVAKRKMDRMKKFSRGLEVHFEEIAIEKEDVVPTCLENKGLGRVGEDIVRIYDTPSIQDRDPSYWVLWAFALFFGIIVNDAGYGFILLAFSLFLAWKFGKKPGLGGRFVKLCLILSSSILIWGVCTNAYFGITLKLDNPLRKISLTSYLVEEKIAYIIDHPQSPLYKEWTHKYPKLTQESTVAGWVDNSTEFREGRLHYDLLEEFTDDVMLEIALLVGVFHLICSFCRVIDRSWAGVGWILFVFGAYLFFPKAVDATSLVHYALGVPKAVAYTAGFQLLWIGIGLAIFLALIQNRLKGLAEAANVIQIFADGLSYLRLYALGLASGLMSTTFNDLAAKAGLIFGILLLLVGHGINIILSLMAGVIHGLRLNFLEWYHHCFEGGGKMLKPLKLFKIGE